MFFAGVRQNPEGIVFFIGVVSCLCKFPDVIRLGIGIAKVISGLGSKDADQVIHLTPEFLKLESHVNSSCIWVYHGNL